MADETTKVEGPYEIHDFTIADAQAVEQGAICLLSDPRTCSGSGLDTGVAFAGIAASEKVASNGKIELGLYTSGIFVMTAVAGGGVTAGNQVVISGANTIRPAVAGDLLTDAVIGVALEDIGAGTTGEVKVGGN